MDKNGLGFWVDLFGAGALAIVIVAVLHLPLFT